MNTEKIVRTTVEVPSSLWSKVRIEKIKRGDESLNDVVVRALEEHFHEEDEETRLLKIQVINEETKYALNNPLEKDELKALYRIYYQRWNKEDLQKQLTQMEEDTEAIR